MADMKQMLREAGPHKTIKNVIVCAVGNDLRGHTIHSQQDEQKWIRAIGEVVDILEDMAQRMDKRRGTMTGIILPYPSKGISKHDRKYMISKIRKMAVNYNSVIPIDVQMGLPSNEFVKKHLYDGVHFDRRVSLKFSI